MLKNKKIKIIICAFIIIISAIFSLNVVFADGDNAVIEVSNVEQLTDALLSAQYGTTNAITYEIKLNQGNYSINETIYNIPKNVCLNLNGNTIYYTGNANEVFFIASSENDIKTNISIKNGTISGGGIYIRQSENITIDNVTIKNCRGNGIYLPENSTEIKLSNLIIDNIPTTGIIAKKTQNLELNNVKIQNCKENGLVISDNSTGVKLTNITFSNIPSTGIYVENSSIETFKQINTNGGVQGAYLNGVNAKDIENCNFSEFTTDGIRINNSKIKKIHNNTISSSKSSTEHAIYIIEKTETEDIYSNYVSSKHGIFLKKSKVNGSINNNTVNKFGDSGIQLYVECTVTGKIYKNTITNGKGTGILVTGPSKTIGGSTCGNIESNVLKNCTGDGIGVYHASHCDEIIRNELDTIGGNHNGNAGDYGIIIDSMIKGDTYCTRIAENKLSNVTYAGIAIYSGPAGSLDNIYQDTAFVAKNIENNVLNNCGMYNHSKDWVVEGRKGCLSGIYVDTHARVKGDICNNTINKTGEHGVYLHLCSYANRIYNNVINNCKEVGIQVHHSTVLGNIENNQINNSGTNGISVSDSSVVKGIIQNNNINSANECGIYMKASTLNCINNNTMKNVKKSGIYLNEKTKMNNIISNNIGMNNQKDGYGIKVVVNSKIKTIQNNKIFGKMLYGIRIMGLSDNVNIINNNVSTNNANGKSFCGIYLVGNNSKKYIVKKNTLVGNKTNSGIRLTQGKADILDNTIKKMKLPINIEKNNVPVYIKGNNISGNVNNYVKTPKQKVEVNNIKISSIKAEKGAKVSLSYKASKIISKFEIYQSMAKNGKYKKIKALGGTKFTTSKLKPNKQYFYKVCGFTKDGKITIYTKYSGIKSIKTKK